MYHYHLWARGNPATRVFDSRHGRCEAALVLAGEPRLKGGSRGVDTKREGG